MDSQGKKNTVDRMNDYQSNNLFFSFTNSEYIGIDYASLAKMKDEHGNYFVKLENGEISVNWKLYYEYYKKYCDKEIQDMVRYTIGQMTKLLEILGIATFISLLEQPPKRFGYPTSIIIEWKQLCLIRQKDIVALGKMILGEDDPEYKERKKYVPFTLP